MTLADKVSELLKQIDLEDLNDFSWRGIIENNEWKILLHKENDGKKYNIIIKQRREIE
jgi:hypothetical protein